MLWMSYVPLITMIILTIDTSTMVYNMVFISSLVKESYDHTSTTVGSNSNNATARRCDDLDGDTIRLRRFLEKMLVVIPLDPAVNILGVPITPSMFKLLISYLVTGVITIISALSSKK